MLRNSRKAILGDFPFLADVRKVYGNRIASSWLVIQIHDLSEYAGQKLKLNEFQTESLAQAIIEKFYFLRVSEIMLFFAKFKSGSYGTFYGSVDPIAIMTALTSFLTERAQVISEAEQDNERKRMDEWLSSTERMTQTEWRSYKPYRQAGYSIQFWRDCLYRMNYWWTHPFDNFREPRFYPI